MDKLPLLAWAAAATAVAVFCGWRGARAPDFRRGPRLVPWRWLMVLSGAAAVLLFATAVRGD